MSKPKIRFNGFTEDWEQRKLGDALCSLQNNTLSRAELTYEEGTIKNVHYGDILVKYGEVLDVKNEQIPNIIDTTAAEKYKASFLQNGDVIFADTAEDETVGKCSEIVGLTDEAALSGLHTIPYRPQLKFATGYLGYYLNSSIFHQQLIPLMQGVKVTSISKSAMQNTDIVYPKSFDEQEKIGAYFMHLDYLITLHQRKWEQTKKLKKFMLQKMFPQNGKSVPEIRFNGFTEDWEQRKLGELGNIMTGSTPSTSHEEYYSDDGIPWVTPTDIETNLISDTPRKLSKDGEKVGRVVPANTILVTCIASIGKNALLQVKGSFNQQINSLTPNDKNDPYFLLTESALWSEKMKKQAAAATMQIVNKTEFSEIETYVPCKEEQYTIGIYFEQLDHLITLHQRKCDELQNMKKFMLQNMFV